MNNNEFELGRIVEKKPLVEGILKFTIETAETHFTAPGQYAELRLTDSENEGVFIVSEYDGKRFTTVFKTDGNPYNEISKLELGDKLEVRTGLGNGYDVDAIPDGAVVMADTTGIPQMLGLLRELLMRGKECRLILGYESKDQVFMMPQFRNLCNNIEVLTADGSNGREGRAYDGIRKAEYVVAAGSVEMLDNLATKAEAGQFNLDGMNVTKW
ncbi:MAG: dihydroorotate dehydrogenase electron transfer subunit [Clostridiales bacterium]|nr:dihydroorotate dehydrogenase electron transfer subunit [Candidatus Crickella equi]